ncbi:HD domain-containing phosphohydrolase [Catenulispora pinistramenti]|uniref:HD domain-containing phosphohydrolase n=1 Tax=Catenulispora pinistramenti TaxID=2705254 RepID=UPI002E78489B|nr:HD domain-containing phosphohydrolase [Catenulispora pinistramenti]
MALSVIATFPLSRTGPRLLLAMCVLVLVAERLSRVQIGASGWTMSVSLVVTLITVVVLAPPAAALVGLTASVPMSRSRKPNWTWPKQILNSAMTSLVPAGGSVVCFLAGGHASGHFLNFPEFLLPVAAAVTTCLVANAVIVAGYTQLSSNARFIDVLRGDIRRATMPYYSSGVLALIFLSLWHDIGWYTALLVIVPMYIAHWSLSQYAKENAAHEGTIAALVQAVEIKDSYTRGHSERVARGSEMLAKQLKMPHDRRAMLRFAGLLHDIGKLGVPTRLLTSTGGLTQEEFKLLCMHPNHGVAVLRDIRFLTEVYEGVLYHHERLDGRGYPTGKSGDDIPQFARIIGVADAFDAMTSTRSYRAARSVQEAVAELRRGAGTQFDPALVRAFEAALEEAARSGTPWVPTELAPAEPQPEDGTTAAAVGPWPLPKRVPGFSFADHDDPFVPAEWFSDWYPSWLAHGGEQDADPGRPVPEVLGGIPGQRVAEPEADSDGSDGSDGSLAGADVGAGDTAGDADLDDGWSERMHSAVVREPGPEPDEGWAWADEAEAKSEPAAESTRWPQDPGLYGGVGLGSMRMRAATPASEPDPRGPVVAPEDAGAADEGEADSVRLDAAAPTADLGSQDSDIPAAASAEPVHLAAAAGPTAEPTASPQDGMTPAAADSADPMRPADAAPSTVPADPARLAHAGPSAADFDLRKPIPACQEPVPAGSANSVDNANNASNADKASKASNADNIDSEDTIPVPRAKPGDREAWAPSPEPWSVPEPTEAPKAAEPADPDPRSAPSGGASWFSRGSSASSSAMRFIGPADSGSWPPRDPEAKDSERSA